MKRLTKIMIGIFVATVLVGLMPQNTSAATNYQLKANGKLNLTNANYLYGENICEIYVPQNGYLMFSISQGNALSYHFCDNNRNDMFSGPQVLDELHGYQALYRVKSGYYYLKNITATGSKVILNSRFVTSFSLDAGKKLTLNTKSHTQDVYVKIKPAKTGIIKVTATSSEQGNVALCNNRYKVISKEVAIQNLDTLDTTTFTFAVEKNQTYFIRLKSQEPVTLTWKNTAMTNAGNTKKAKGTILKSGKTYQGLALPQDMKVRWFRISLKKKTPIRLAVNGFTHGQLHLSIYDKDQYELANYIISSATQKDTVVQTESTYPPGTYYVAVRAADKESNGWYSLKWY